MPDKKHDETRQTWTLLSSLGRWITRLKTRVGQGLVWTRKSGKTLTIQRSLFLLLENLNFLLIPASKIAFIVSCFQFSYSKKSCVFLSIEFYFCEIWSLLCLMFLFWLPGKPVFLFLYLRSTQLFKFLIKTYSIVRYEWEGRHHKSWIY